MQICGRNTLGIECCALMARENPIFIKGLREIPMSVGFTFWVIGDAVKSGT